MTGGQSAKAVTVPVCHAYGWERLPRASEGETNVRPASDTLQHTPLSESEAAGLALFVTNFHWGLHVWAIYAIAIGMTKRT